MATEDLPIKSFSTVPEFDKWLAANHDRSPGVWVKIAKKGSAVETIDYGQALGVALCYGWIDGQKGKLDETFWLQRFTPRKQGSKWSKINRDKVEALIASGAMKPHGLREVERAKAGGQWEAAYDGQKSAGIPDDLAEALATNKAAADFFATLDSRNRFSVLHRVQDAKKPETRARRIAQYVAMLAENKKIHP